MTTIHTQTLGGTSLDLQGERLTKAFLEQYCAAAYGKRVPLHREHDMARPTVGYIENIRLVPDADHAGEWRLVGDVSLEEGELDECL